MTSSDLSGLYYVVATGQTYTYLIVTSLVFFVMAAFYGRNMLDSLDEGFGFMVFCMCLVIASLPFYIWVRVGESA
jgi:hypothetical protein